MDEALWKRLSRFRRLSTIDLRPDISEHFELRAEVMQRGSRVASTRLEFLGSDGKLLSTGAGACGSAGPAVAGQAVSRTS
ncbi:hypothetical protein BSY239_347 [Hydrogenophaga sp. RAC07]|nr:hypothetical protein BSY239_347 [Hydrogenophaga sp. RAC07]